MDREIQHPVSKRERVFHPNLRFGCQIEHRAVRPVARRRGTFSSINSSGIWDMNPTHGVRAMQVECNPGKGAGSEFGSLYYPDLPRSKGARFSQISLPFCETICGKGQIERPVAKGCLFGRTLTGYITKLRVVARFMIRAPYSCPIYWACLMNQTTTESQQIQLPNPSGSPGCR
jgi:hypothetical protein